MGIIIREISSGFLLFIVKGADVVIKDTVKQIYKGFIIDECDNLALEGLRTLVYSYKVLT